MPWTRTPPHALEPGQGPVTTTADASCTATARLTPRIPRWPYLALATPVLAAITGALCALLDLPTTTLIGATAATLAAGAATTVGSYQTFQRDRVIDNATEGLLSVLGARTPTRSLLTARRWRGGFIEHPQTVGVRYAKHLDGRSPELLASIQAVLQRELGMQYQLAKHNKRGKSMVFTVATSEQTEPQQADVVAERIVAMAIDLLGTTATVAIDHDDHGEVAAVSVTHQQAAVMAMAGRRTRIERAMSTKLPGARWKAQWDLANDRVRFTQRPELPGLVPLPQDHQKPPRNHTEYKKTAVPYGVDEDREDLYWKPALHAHLLIIGGTGSGKTVVQHSLVEQLTQAQWETWIVDGKRIEFIGFRGWPNVTLIGSKIEHQIRIIYAAHERMEERYAAKEEGRANVEDWEPLLLVIDELTTFLKRVERFYKDTKPKGAPAKPPVLDLLADILRLGRSAKIHVVVGMQRPDVEFVGGEMRDNFGARLSLGRLSPQGAVMMWGSAGIGVAIPRSAKGRGVGINDDGRAVEIQTYYAPNPDPFEPDYDPAAVQAVRARTTAHPPLQILEVAPDQDLDGHDITPTFEDYTAAKITPAPATAKAEAAPDHTSPSRSHLDEIPHPAGEGSTPVPDHETSNPDADNDALEADLASAGYGPMEHLPVSDLEPGMLWLHEDLGAWTVIETLDEDPLDPAYLLIDHRCWTTGAPDTDSLDTTLIITVRRPAL